MTKRALYHLSAQLAGITIVAGCPSAIFAATYSFNETFDAPPLTAGTTDPNGYDWENGFANGDNGWTLIEQPTSGANYGQRAVSFWPHNDDTAVANVRVRSNVAPAYAIRDIATPLATGNVTIVMAAYTIIGDIDYSLRIASDGGAVNALKLDFGAPQFGTDINDFFRAKQDNGGDGDVTVADANTQTTDGAPLKWNINGFSSSSGDYLILSVDFNNLTHSGVVNVTTVDALGTHRSIAPIDLSLNSAVTAIDRISLSANTVTSVNGNLSYLGNISITGETAVSASEWAVDNDGSWSVSGNWLGGVPNGVGATANFGTIITSAHTVTVDATQTVGQINFSSPIAYTVSGSSTITLDGGTGATAINVTAGSHVIDAPILLAKNTDVSVSGGGSLSVKHVRGAGLSVSGGAMKVTAKGTANDPSGTSVVTGLSVGSGASLDLTNNSMIVDYTTVGTLVDDTRLMLQSGKLTTSSSGGKIGYGDNAVLAKGSFAGQTPDSTSLLIKFTYGGDANLDGQVDISDLGALATAWQTSAPWTGGDFDYSGFVDISDLGILATNWQLGVGSPLGPSFDEALASVGLAGVSVPEPTVLGLALLGAFSLNRSRRSIANRNSRFANS